MYGDEATRAQAEQRAAGTGSARAAYSDAQGAPRKPEYNLGILLVHGLGEAKRGETLAWAGEPVYEWLNRWLNRAPSEVREGNVYLADTNLTESDPRDPRAPAHTEIRFTAETGDNAGQERRWLVAESLWAPTFPQASFGSIVSWGLNAAPLARPAQRLESTYQHFRLH